jgi:hypothetical protein
MEARYKFKSLEVLLRGVREMKINFRRTFSAYLFNFSVLLLGLVRI